MLISDGNLLDCLSRNWRKSMYIDNDVLYEVNDLDEDIRLREELIEAVKNIQAEENLNEAIREALTLQRKWKRIQFWESVYEEKLMEEFESYINAIYGIRNEGYEKNKMMKEELIHQARALSSSQHLSKATKEMEVLMQQWKSIGTAGKETDDVLWGDFNEARQTFFEHKHENWVQMQEKFENTYQLKKRLIEQAAALCNSEEWQKTSEEYRILMDQWKAAGSAGKEHEDELWNEFNTNRQKFYARREVYYEEMHEQQEERFLAKKDIVAKALALVSCKEYTKEHTEQLKNLGAEWKRIGSCGKKRESHIWQEFRSIMDGYFEGLKAYNEQKHMEWRQRMMASRNKKQDLIANQKRQIKYMQNEMVGLLGQRAIDEMEESIEEKNNFIKELEIEIADIDKKLNQ